MMTLDELQIVRRWLQEQHDFYTKWYGEIHPESRVYRLIESTISHYANGLSVIDAEIYHAEKPSQVCQNCGTDERIGWHEVRTSVDDVQCPAGDDSHQEIEY